MGEFSGYTELIKVLQFVKNDRFSSHDNRHASQYNTTEHQHKLQLQELPCSGIGTRQQSFTNTPVKQYTMMGSLFVYICT